MKKLKTSDHLFALEDRCIFIYSMISGHVNALGPKETMQLKKFLDESCLMPKEKDEDSEIIKLQEKIEKLKDLLMSSGSLTNMNSLNGRLKWYEKKENVLMEISKL